MNSKTFLSTDVGSLSRGSGCDERLTIADVPECLDVTRGDDDAFDDKSPFDTNVVFMLWLVCDSELFGPADEDIAVTTAVFGAVEDRSVLVPDVVTYVDVISEALYEIAFPNNDVVDFRLSSRTSVDDAVTSALDDVGGVIENCELIRRLGSESVTDALTTVEVLVEFFTSTCTTLPSNVPVVGMLAGTTDVCAKHKPTEHRIHSSTHTVSKKTIHLIFDYNF